MSKSQSMYRSVVKSTAIFGGVQIVQILVSLIRGKMVAILLGTVGMGINNLIISAMNIVVQVVGLGINFSAVREISQATEKNEENQKARTIAVVKKWLLFSALLGVVITICFAPLLSRFSFGSGEYSWSFVWVSIVVAFTILSNGNIALLQGMRKLRFVAKSTLVGSIIGLTSAFPLYWFYGVDGIVPALIVGAFFTFLAGWYFVKKCDVTNVKVPINDAANEGAEMVKLGIVSMVAGLLGALSIYVINSFVSTVGTLSDVGLYSSAVSISNQYIGVLFTAMAADYFPRLSAVSGDIQATNRMVNQQGEVVVLIAAPLLMLMMCTAPLLIEVLLSSQFLPIRNFICWMAFGMFFKATYYPLGYIAFAKGDKKMYFWFEAIAGNGSLLLMNMLGYYLGGLLGLAISFVVLYAVFFVLYWIITSRRYGFVFEREYLKVWVRLLILVASVFLATQFLSGWLIYVVGGVVSVISSVYCYKELNKRIGIGELIRSKFRSK